jgi:hypothetical protein
VFDSHDMGSRAPPGRQSTRSAKGQSSSHDGFLRSEAKVGRREGSRCRPADALPASCEGRGGTHAAVWKTARGPRWAAEISDRQAGARPPLLVSQSVGLLCCASIWSNSFAAFFCRSSDRDSTRSISSFTSFFMPSVYHKIDLQAEADREGARVLLRYPPPVVVSPFLGDYERSI